MAAMTHGKVIGINRKADGTTRLTVAASVDDHSMAYHLRQTSVLVREETLDARPIPLRVRLKDEIRWDGGALCLVPQDGPPQYLPMLAKPE